MVEGTAWAKAQRQACRTDRARSLVGLMLQCAGREQQLIGLECQLMSDGGNP